ncbi:hypothetical protein NQ315_002805 [Exocentrus adspersus]|uniref:Reverse transcriptase n=1 Tax=Exocentrus adspersus TaxID=1586481 RepID=A0AAV8VK58_9CUCU|nr:hypothetical protein NQ315_002805 [Exocentrus adspersus]
MKLHRRVVFGVNCSPFLLGVTLQYHFFCCLERSKQQSILYSEQTVKKLMKSFYVDNCVTSVENEEYLVEFIEEAKLAMMEGKFNLRGWEFSGNTKDEEFNVSVLGLKWYTNKDEMVINYELLKLDTEECCVTKRKNLSMAQKVFDPIGFTCPTTLIPKLILQKLWKEKMTWDEVIEVLTWIQRNDQWSTFVFNRVKEICNLTFIENWNHISGIKNPADLPSRGCSPKPSRLS